MGFEGQLNVETRESHLVVPSPSLTEPQAGEWESCETDRFDKAGTLPHVQHEDYKRRTPSAGYRRVCSAK